MPINRNNPFYGLEKQMTEEQWAFCDAVIDNIITFVNAKPGTGKTTLAVALAHYLVKSNPKLYSQAYYVFAPVEENKMGFRPGTQKEKEEEYYTPLKQALIEINEGRGSLILDDEDRKRGRGWIEPVSHTFLRGTNLKGAVIIVEEAQNFTRAQMKKTLTRVHDNDKAMVIGHSGQIDLPNPEMSGFVPYVEHFSTEDYCAICELTKNFRGKVSTHADTL